MCKKRKSACKFDRVLHLLELVKGHFASPSIFKWVDHLRTGSAGLRPATPELDPKIVEIYAPFWDETSFSCFVFGFMDRMTIMVLLTYSPKSR